MRFFKETLHVVLVTGIIGVIGGCNYAMAESYVTTGNLISKQPIYTNITVTKPRQVCRNVEVPVYGTVQNNNSGASGGDVLAGAIIGGILGKALTGQDNGAAFGALAGAMTSAEKKKGGTSQQIIGHRTEQRCRTEYRDQQSQVANQYRLTYNVNGNHVTYTVNKAVGQNAYIGQTKRFRVRFQMLN